MYQTDASDLRGKRNDDSAHERAYRRTKDGTDHEEPNSSASSSLIKNIGNDSLTSDHIKSPLKPSKDPHSRKHCHVYRQRRAY